MLRQVALGAVGVAGVTFSVAFVQGVTMRRRYTKEHPNPGEDEVPKGAIEGLVRAVDALKLVKLRTQGLLDESIIHKVKEDTRESLDKLEPMVNETVGSVKRETIKKLKEVRTKISAEEHVLQQKIKRFWENKMHDFSEKWRGVAARQLPPVEHAHIQLQTGDGKVRAEDLPKMIQGEQGERKTALFGARKVNLIILGDSLVSGVGCLDAYSPSDEVNGPILPRFLATALSAALNVDVQWRAIGLVGGTVTEIRRDLMPKVREDLVSARGVDRPSSPVLRPLTRPSLLPWSAFRSWLPGRSSISSMDPSDEVTDVTVVVIICGLNDWKTLFTEFPGSSPGSFRKELSLLVDNLRQATGPEGLIFLPAIPLALAESSDLQKMPLKFFIDVVSGLWDVQKKYVGSGSCRDDRGHGPTATFGTWPMAGSARKVYPVSDGDGECIYIGIPEHGYVSSHYNSSFLTSQSLIGDDGVHPSSSGYKLWALHIADKIVERLKVGSCHVNQSRQCHQEDEEQP